MLLKLKRKVDLYSKYHYDIYPSALSRIIGVIPNVEALLKNEAVVSNKRAMNTYSLLMFAIVESHGRDGEVFFPYSVILPRT